MHLPPKSIDHQYSHELKAMLDTMREGMLFISCKGFIWLCNQRVNHLLNKNLQERTNFKDFIEDNFFGFSLTKHLKNKTSPDTTLLTIASQKTRHLEIISNFVPLDTSSTSQREGLLIVVRDLTSAHLLQEELTRQERLESLGTLAASLAHEIRNPLTAIEGFAGLLRQDLKNNTQQLELVEHILEGARAIGYLITNMLDYAKPLQVQIKRTPLLQPLKDSVAMAIASKWCRSEDIHLTCKDDLKVSCDVQLLKSCLLNLIRNASEAKKCNQQQSIEIEAKTSADQNQVHICVKDQGIGIAEQDVEKIFSPFFTTKPAGTGLGLSQVDKMMRAQAGSVTVTSKQAGTSFTLILPSKHPFVCKKNI